MAQSVLGVVGECSLAAARLAYLQPKTTTLHMIMKHTCTGIMRRLHGAGWGEFGSRALALSHTASVRRDTA